MISIRSTTCWVRTRAALPVFAVLLSLSAPGTASAQSGFSVTPPEISQGGCYWMIVAGGNADMVLNLEYSLDWGSPQVIWGWPALDVNGQALICTDAYTVYGTYRFHSYSSNQNSTWQWTDASITVTAPWAPPGGSTPQPTSLQFYPAGGYAGNDCYVMAIGNGADMTVDLRYAFNNDVEPEWTTAMNESGEWPYCLNHYDRAGRYDYYDMKNHLAWDWVQVSPIRPASYTVRPPQPKSLTINPPVIVQGQPYTMTAANGADVTFDLQYTLNGASQTQVGWPSLFPSYYGSIDGIATIQTSTLPPATPAGRYVFTAIRNTLNTPWAPVNVPLTVCPNAPPTITAISPGSGIRGTSVSVTITGTNLCAPVLSTPTWGLTFSNQSWSFPYTSITFTATISSAASPGNAPIQLNTMVGVATASFAIAQPVSLTKEYIYLGPRIIATEVP